ncbi:MAG: hypothetical protein R3A78_10050 [Polyangiales bacterium]
MDRRAVDGADFAAPRDDVREDVVTQAAPFWKVGDPTHEKRLRGTGTNRLRHTRGRIGRRDATVREHKGGGGVHRSRRSTGKLPREQPFGDGRILLRVPASNRPGFMDEHPEVTRRDRTLKYVAPSRSATCVTPWSEISSMPGSPCTTHAL